MNGICYISTERHNSRHWHYLPFSCYLSYCSLNACKLTVNCCEILANSVSSSHLRELDLGNNNLTDTGVIRLYRGLKKSELETLRSVSNKFLSLPPCLPSVWFLAFSFIFCSFRLRSCNLTENSSEVLASVISSASSKLKVLDLSDNDFQDVGVKNLCGGLGTPHCKLEILTWVPWVIFHTRWIIWQQSTIQCQTLLLLLSVWWNLLPSFFKFVPVQTDRRKLHLPGICFELIRSERAWPELQPPRKLRPGAAVCSARRPTMQPAETQVVVMSTRAWMINQLAEIGLSQIFGTGECRLISNKILW